MGAQQTLTLTLLFLLAAATASNAASPRLIKLLRREGEARCRLFKPYGEEDRLGINYANCLSWRTGVEAHNIINFKRIPDNCVDYVSDYLLTLPSQYRADSKTVCKEAYFYSNATVNKDTDVFIFDLDDTLLSSIPYFEEHKNESFDPKKFEEYISKGENPVLPESIHLYYNILCTGAKAVILTERSEELESVTIQNLRNVGYGSWEDIIFRPQNTTLATTEDFIKFKSGVRQKLVEAGYNIIGNIGDQWSDLLGDAPALRSFKLPNPMYFQ